MFPINDIMGFIATAFNRHCSGDGKHRADFELCPDLLCRQARQLEIYLILTRQWHLAAFPYLIQEAQDDPTDLLRL